MKKELLKTIFIVGLVRYEITLTVDLDIIELVINKDSVREKSIVLPVSELNIMYPVNKANLIILDKMSGGRV